MTDSLYTTEVKRIIKSFNFPKNLVVDIVEYEFHLAMRFYRENINSLDGVDKTRFAYSLNDCLWKIRNTGIPIYTEVVPGNGYDSKAN